TKPESGSEAESITLEAHPRKLESRPLRRIWSTYERPSASMVVAKHSSIRSATAGRSRRMLSGRNCPGVVGAELANIAVIEVVLAFFGLVDSRFRWFREGSPHN